MVNLRKAVLEDCQTVFKWRNHPKIREYFFDNRGLSYDEHRRWFEESLERGGRAILLALEGDRPVGVIRFDLDRFGPDTAEIDIYVSPENQGRGLGKAILSEGMAWIKKNSAVKRAFARVKRENKASIGMFRGCGFEESYVVFSREV